MLPQTLLSELRGRGIDVEHPDGDSVVLRQLPLCGFNKPATNLLVIRPGADLPFVALVDQDLEYLGSEKSIKAALTQPAVQGGWRPLLVNVTPELDVTIDRALRVIAFPWSPPRGEPTSKPVSRPADGPLLSRFGRPMIADEAHLTIGRQEQSKEAVACLRRCDVCLPLIVGPSGAGKTNLLLDVSGQWARATEAAIIEIDLVGFISTLPTPEHARNLRELLNELIESGIPGAIQQIELLVSEISYARLLLSQALDRGIRLIGTTTRDGADQFNAGPLTRRIHIVELNELTPEELIAILLEKRLDYAIDIDPVCANVAVRVASALPGAFPAKAVSLLDSAVAQAELNGAKVLGPDDIYAAADRVRPFRDVEAEEQT